MTQIRNKLKFVRYGGLSGVPQKGYDPAFPTFHSPPARRGIYAFVWPFIEFFLLGKNTFDQRRMEWIRDDKGVVIDENHPEFKDWLKKEKFSTYPRNGVYALATHKDPVAFEYEGELWHHLEIKRNETLASRGGWVLSDYSTYIKALRREIGRNELMRKREGYSYSKDHLEVFIEKI